MGDIATIRAAVAQAERFDIATLFAAALAPSTSPLVGRLQAMLRQMIAEAMPPYQLVEVPPYDPTPEQVTAFIDRLHGATGYRFPVHDEAVFRHGVREGLKAVREIAE